MASYVRLRHCKRWPQFKLNMAQLFPQNLNADLPIPQRPGSWEYTQET